MDSLKDKVVIVTGAGSGIGQAISLLFGSHGCRLVLADIEEKGLQETQRKLEQKCEPGSCKVVLVKADISKEDDRQRIINQCIQDFGRLDILVNNAGIVVLSSLSDVSSDNYDRIMDVNLKSHVFLSLLAVPYLKETRGNIVNTSSIISSEVVTKSGVYCMSKAGIQMFTKLLALEMAEFGVRVNAVRPGTTKTGIFDRNDFTDPVVFMSNAELEHPLGRIADPEEIANAVVFLASDKSSFTTGTAITVDGGRLCVGARYSPISL